MKPMIKSEHKIIETKDWHLSKPEHEHELNNKLSYACGLFISKLPTRKAL